MVRKLGAKLSRPVAGRPDDEASGAAGSPNAAEGRPHDSVRRQRLVLYVAALALAVAVGHVVYAVIRDHVFDGSIF